MARRVHLSVDFFSIDDDFVIEACYQCSHCLKRLPSERLLRDHMNQHGSEPPGFVQIFSYVWIVVSESLQVSSLPDDVSDDVSNDVRASASRRSSALCDICNFR